MQPEVGKIYEGKVKGITKYGAFVEIAEGVTGMVHISEVANTFVNEIREHLTENQTVKVKVLNITDDGKISLSIKKAVEIPASQQRFQRNNNSQSRPRNNYSISTLSLNVSFKVAHLFFAVLLEFTEHILE